MWVFTQTGFVSAVRKADALSKITVRSRDKQSLEVLAELSETEIIETPYADYGYRVLVSDDIYKVWLATTVDMLDYDNFKNRISKSRGHVFHHALGNVWSEMLAVAD
jgi:hypothetical protein